MSDLISIKGGRDGLRVRLDPGAAWPALIEGLAHELSANQSFFVGARLVIDIGDRQLDEVQLAEILDLMRRHGVTADALDASARTSRSAARAAGLTARPLPRYPEPPQQAPAAPESDAILLTRTVRSGQVVRHHGHITLIGDVNPGAELIAGGSIVVWGRLKGMVHAGALGNADAVICALELRPTQLRIAQQIATSPSGRGPRNPEVARVEDGQIVVEPWEAFKR
jgi:septum site-determining protein MinC